MLAVKLYKTMPKDDENVLNGISPKIPSIVLFTNTLPDKTYQLMTEQEYSQYLLSINKELADWKLIQDNLPQPQEILEV